MQAVHKIEEEKNDTTIKNITKNTTYKLCTMWYVL